MLKYKVLPIIILFLSFLTEATAQEVRVTAQLDSNHIIIGDQLQLHLTATAPAEKNITFANTEKWDLQNCEIVESKPITKKIVGKESIYSLDVILTSFDTGRAVIAPIPVFETDTLLLTQTNLLQFIVDSLPVFVDTTLDFKDIKAPMEGKDIELTDEEHADSRWWKILLWICIIAAIIAVGGYYLTKYVKKYWKERKAAENKAKLKLNASHIALNSLKELKIKKLWQKGQVKDYYSELSMILRTYISNQWDVNAKEMVTPDIMDAVYELDIDEGQMKELQKILETADLAKFAKWQPQIEENENSLKKASTFVQATDSVEKAKLAEQNQNKQKKRA